MDEQNLIIHKIFSGIVSRFPDSIALGIKKEDLWQTFTYKKLETDSLKIAAFLIKQGFKKDDHIALILENRPEWAIIYLGIMYAGLTCVPLDPELSRQELYNLVMDSACEAIFSSFDIFTQKIKPDLQERPIKNIVLDAPEPKNENFISFSDILNTEPDETILPEVCPDDTASLIYTSGTTAEPKGVLLTHKNICSNFRSIEKLNIVFTCDNFLSVLPLYHTYAFTVTLITPLFLGATVTYFNLKIKPQELNSIIKEAKVTILTGVPQIFSMLHKAIFDKIKKIPSILVPLIFPFIRSKVRNYFGKSLRLLVSGGARLQPRIGRDLSKLGFKLIEGFGLTETSPIVTLNPPERIKFGSVGKPIPDVQIKIFEPDKFGIGEVLIKGPNVMKGYFKRPDLTSQVIKNGWFYSGDLGSIDKQGYLFLTGRIKDVIVLSSGKNIYPEELEEYFSRSPFIKEICILSKTEERFGHAVDSLYAVVVPNLEYFRQKDVKDIRGKIRWELENLAKELPAYKHIMGLVVTKEELPRTALKKIKRYQVKEKYFEQKICPEELKETVLSEEEARILEKDISKKVINYLSSQLNKPVCLDSHLEIDLGIDSLSRLELQLGLESHLSLKLPDEVSSGFSTVRDVIMALSEIIEKRKLLPQEGKITQKDWSQLLNDLPEEKILKKIKLENSFLEKFITWLLKSIFLFIFRIFWLLRIKGRDNLPSSGPYIICPNHASYLDGFIVSVSLKYSLAVNTFFLGYSDILEHPLISWAIKLTRLIPLDPNNRLTEAMQTVSFVLRHKKIACIFPEGRRSVDERIGEFKKGVGILVKELGMPVVPAYIEGSHRSWPRTSRSPRLHPVKIIFGRPVTGQELINRMRAKGITDDYEAITQGLREEVVSLARMTTSGRR
jgi:long-chain acyl-CoA synthetase